MFERYTEKARRVIFFARYEASQFGKRQIETEHLVLGLLREDKALTNRFLRSHASVESIRRQIEKNTTIQEKISTSVDLPLSDESKRVLAYAAEEAQHLGDKHIGTEHLLLGLLREEESFGAAMLNERGLKLEAVREELARIVEEPSLPSPPQPAPLGDFTRDLTQAAQEGELGALVGRKQELEALIEVLSGSMRANALLIGDRGVGKRAIVEGLAQRIADGVVPLPLAERRLHVLDAQTVAGWALRDMGSTEHVNQTIKALIDASGSILVIDDLQLFVTAVVRRGSAVAGNIFKHWLARAKLQCISTCTPEEHRVVTQTAQWVADCFRVIHVSPLDAERTLQALQARKQKLEALHGVTYAEDALSCAVELERRYLPQGQMPGKVLELLDAAGARVKLRLGAPTAEIVECAKRVEFIAKKVEEAIENQEFEKARFYSEEEKKEQENLRILRERHHLDEGAAMRVTRADVEEVIARWGKYPYVE